MSKCITPKGRVSYPHLFEARKAPGSDKAKYSLTLLFTDDPEVPAGSNDIDELKAAMLAAAYEKFGDTDDTRKKIKAGKIRMPLLEPEEGKYPDEYVLEIRMNSSEQFKPQVVDRFKGKDGKPAVITDPDDLYPGCWARASVRAFGYDVSGNKGVAFALNNVQKLADDERLDNRTSAQDEFEAEESEAGADDLDGALDDMLTGKKKA